MSAEIKNRGSCPKCGVHCNPPVNVAWGYWTQIAGDKHGGAFEIMPEFSQTGAHGDEALRVTCPICGFEFLEPILESGQA